MLISCTNWTGLKDIWKFEDIWIFLIFNIKSAVKSHDRQSNNRDSPLIGCNMSRLYSMNIYSIKASSTALAVIMLLISIHATCIHADCSYRFIQMYWIGSCMQTVDCKCCNTVLSYWVFSRLNECVCFHCDLRCTGNFSILHNYISESNIKFEGHRTSASLSVSSVSVDIF